MNKKGFTLIELLIVVVIIGILAAIAIPKFGESRQKAYMSTVQADMNQLRTAMELCYSDNDFTYADCDESLINTSGDAVSVTVADADATTYTMTGTHTGAPDDECTYDHTGGDAPGRIVCAGAEEADGGAAD